MNDEKVKRVVRESYGKIAKREGSCCGPAKVCCGGANLAETISEKIGYTDEELKAVPDGANLGLGCGNPLALASLKEGETVLDLGSGAGFDCFLAAGRVGENAKVIGVDMTPEMVEKARENARRGGYRNVEFRLGEIENLPAADNLADVVLSNCVINLVPDKKRAFREAFRVLKPGGRLIVSDIVLVKELPAVIKNSVEAYVGCLSGAAMKNEYMETIKEAGFQNVEVLAETPFPIECMANDPTAKAVIAAFNIPLEELQRIADSVVSITVCAIKPRRVG